MAVASKYAHAIHPLVRTLRYFMDNCAGTNKSQFMFGAIGLLLAFGVIDACLIFFMIPGHTKFECDKAARHTAGGFQHADVFNHGMLNQLFSRYVTARAYNGDVLLLLKEVTPELFTEIPGISSHRSFILVADDGGMGEDLVPCDSSGTFTRTSIDVAVRRLAARSTFDLVKRMRALPLSYGIGSGGELFPPSPEDAWTPTRTVRLFMAEAETSGEYKELRGWHKKGKRTSACLYETLAGIKTFNEADADADGKKGLAAPYGQMQKQFEEQYSSYVPTNRAPDEYDVAASGATGTMSYAFFDECLSAADKLRCNMSQMAEVVETVLVGAFRSMDATFRDLDAAAAAAARRATQGIPADVPLEPAPKTTTTKRAYSSKTDDETLLGLCPLDAGTDLPTKPDLKRRREIAGEMGLELKQLDGPLARLCKKGCMRAE